MTQLELNKQILSDPQIRKKVALHEAAHFVMLILYCKQMCKGPEVEMVTIMPAESENLGWVRQTPLVFPAFLEHESAYAKSLAIKQHLAGLASEFLTDNGGLDEYGFFDTACEIDESPESDISRAYEIAQFSIGKFELEDTFFKRLLIFFEV